MLNSEYSNDIADRLSVTIECMGNLMKDGRLALDDVSHDCLEVFGATAWEPQHNLNEESLSRWLSLNAKGNREEMTHEELNEFLDFVDAHVGAHIYYTLRQAAKMIESGVAMPAAEQLRVMTQMLSDILDSALLDVSDVAKECLEVFDITHWEPRDNLTGEEAVRWCILLGKGESMSHDELNHFMALVKPSKGVPLYWTLRQAWKLVEDYDTLLPRDEMPKYVGIDVGEFDEFTGKDMVRALKKDPTVVFIKEAKMTQGEFDAISIAYQSGHEVRLIHDGHEVANIEWLSPPVR